MSAKLSLSAFAIVCLALLLPMLAQNKPSASPLQQAISAKDYTKADSIWKKETSAFIAIRNFDTLLYYIPIAGKINHALHGADKAVTTVLDFIEGLKKENVTPSFLAEAYTKAALEFFSTIGRNEQGYKACSTALDYTLSVPDHTEQDIAKHEYNLGNYAHRMGNVALSLKHHRRSINIREADKNTNAEDLYFSANAMGSLMWYASKYDSAVMFFNKALDALAKMPVNDVNQYFRPANVQNNLAALYSADGKTTEAIKAMENTISNFQRFINSTDPLSDSKKQSATEGLFEAVDNLGGIYKEIGDYGKTRQLLEYSYQQKKLKLDSSYPGIFISEILLGQHYQQVREYDSSMRYLEMGLEKLERADGDYLFWAADAYYALALIHENKKEYAQAAAAYAKSENLYETSFQGQYDNVYMDFLRNLSLFYANTGNYPAAFERANKVYQYLLRVDGGNSLQAFYQLLNIAEINYLTGRYQDALSRTQHAMDVVEKKMKESKTRIDSVKIEVFKPKGILISAKALYALQKNRDSVFLKNLSMRLEEALAMLEKRKVLIDDETSINILMSDHKGLIDFAKKIELELATLTGNSLHLDRLINLQESALYNRIRSRLDKRQAILFSRIPASVQKEEAELKKALTTSLEADRSNSELMNAYIQASDRWTAHLEKVKKEYPAYYTMRYARLFKSVPELQPLLPDSTTVVRYFFVDSSLMALVLDRQQKKLIPIEGKGLEAPINILLNNSREKEQLTALHQLYQQVWLPVAPWVQTKKVTIIPDGVLYNLSFDMLTKDLLAGYKELATRSLLADHIFSYHYSLFMLGSSEMADPGIKANYVAFAPGFSDEVKNNYLAVAKDSVTMDHQYMHLLPQPATNKLAKRMHKLFAGDIFLGDASTIESFKNHAAGHKIIHIGTHASYNNIRPEQSGLIFAKNSAPPADSNFLSLFDIYSCDIQSDLTVLTACESGRPGYQDGEGMVSLAHAFNYAGSKRILTALWKIDEQASSQITETFMRLLKSGYHTDEALRQAKLEYLQKAEGRVLAPAYWAGLVMIGEPATLRFEPTHNYVWWAIGGVLAVALLAFILFKYTKKK